MSLTQRRKPLTTSQLHGSEETEILSTRSAQIQTAQIDEQEKMIWIENQFHRKSKFLISLGYPVFNRVNE